MENMMKDWAEMWEKNMSSYMDEIVKSNHFMKNLLSTYEPMMDLNRNLEKNKEKFFQTFGVASKQDMVKLSQKVHDVEIKLSDILEKMEDTENNDKELMKSIESLKDTISSLEIETKKDTKSKKKSK